MLNKERSEKQKYSNTISLNMPNDKVLTLCPIVCSDVVYQKEFEEWTRLYQRLEYYFITQTNTLKLK